MGMTFRPSLRAAEEMTSIVSLALGKEGLDGHGLLQQRRATVKEQKQISGLDVEQLKRRIHYMSQLVKVALSSEEMSGHATKLSAYRPSPMSSRASSPIQGRSPAPGRSPIPSPRPEAAPAVSPAPRSRF